VPALMPGRRGEGIANTRQSGNQNLRSTGRSWHVSRIVRSPGVVCTYARLKVVPSDARPSNLRLSAKQRIKAIVESAWRLVR
jgi:hypothetical protein